MGPLVTGVGGQIAPSVMRFLSQEACDPSLPQEMGEGHNSLWKPFRECYTLSGAGGGRSGWPGEWLCLPGTGSTASAAGSASQGRQRGRAAVPWPSEGKQARDLAILSCVPLEETAWSWRGSSVQPSLPLSRHTSQRRTSGKAVPSEESGQVQRGCCTEHSGHWPMKRWLQSIQSFSEMGIEPVIC